MVLGILGSRALGLRKPYAQMFKSADKTQLHPGQKVFEVRAIELLAIFGLGFRVTNLFSCLSNHRSCFEMPLI